MLLIISFIYAFIVISLLKDKIKKRPYIFYIIPFIILIIILYLLAIKAYETMPRIAWIMIVSPFKNGAFSFAIISIVMYLGALDKKNKWVKQLMEIRTELSIFGGIFVYLHVISYGIFYFPAVFGLHPMDMSIYQVVATIITLINICVLTPLFITSFQSIRKTMSPAKWKKLQRLAYVFYTLVYFHVMVIFMNRLNDHILDIVLYSIVFITYVVLRIRKARS